MVDDEFEGFVCRVEPQLRRALAMRLTPDQVSDALAEAFAYAWQHWRRVQRIENPAGYLFRVAQSKSRRRKQGFLIWPGESELPGFEPGLLTALQQLSDAQRTAVWLVHGCGWTYAETATAMRVSSSTVGTHVARGLAQ